jgi:UDP-N-acetyl-2-amino-2-deoxyglucuronate dehydrogenase
MKKLRIAFCGLGNAAAFYYEILKHYSEEGSVDFIAGFDAIESKATDWYKKTGISSYSNLKNLENYKIDLVIVTTPSGSHAKDSRFFLENQINVLCEKPIGLKVDEVKSNIAYAKEKRLEYGGVFQNRFNEPIKFLKNKIESGSFGKIISSSVKLQWSRPQSYYEDGWHGTWLQDGGVINQQAIHHLDALFFLLGQPHHLVGFSGNIINKLEAEDTFVGAGTFTDNGFFTIEATTAIRPQDLQASIEVIGTNAQAGIGGGAINQLEYFIQDGQKISHNSLQMHSEDVSSGFGNGHSKMMQMIINDWIKLEKLILPISAAESLCAVQAVHSFYRSVEDGEIIDFNSGLGSSKLGQ